MLSFTIKNIDVREKLKREIAPLLSRTRKEAEAARLAQSLERENSREILEMIEEQSLREQGKNLNPPIVRNNSVGLSSNNIGSELPKNARGLSGVGGERERAGTDVPAVGGNQAS